MARWFVYVVRCRDGSLYTGISTDVAARVARHNAGTGARYTRARRPVSLLYVERKRSQSTALRREAFIKSLPRDQKLKLLKTIPAAPKAKADDSDQARPTAARAPTKRASRKPVARTTALAAGVSAAGIVLGLLFLGQQARGQSARATRPERVAVPAGKFVQGGAQGDDDERPVRDRVLKAFVIDKTEVTRIAFAACVAAHRCKAVPKPHQQPVGAAGDLPITGVSWFDARDYCQFAGGRLPSEAEWEKAARGSDGRTFPWGGESSCDRANWGNYDGEGPCAGKNPGFPVAVGRYEAGASPYGALDMAGNVWEWVADRYDEEPGRRVVRGGSCCSYFVPPRAANRNAWAPTYRDGDLGFRCAADR